MDAKSRYMFLTRLGLPIKFWTEVFFWKRMTIYYMRCCFRPHGPRSGKTFLRFTGEGIALYATSRFLSLRHATDSVRGTPVPRATAAWAKIWKEAPCVAAWRIWACKTCLQLPKSSVTQVYSSFFNPFLAFNIIKETVSGEKLYFLILRYKYWALIGRLWASVV